MDKNLGICKDFNNLEDLIAFMKTLGKGFDFNYSVNSDYLTLIDMVNTGALFFEWCIKRTGSTCLWDMTKSYSKSLVYKTLTEDLVNYHDTRWFEIEKLGGSWFISPQLKDLSLTDCQKCYYWLEDGQQEMCQTCLKDGKDSKYTTCIECISCGHYEVEKYNPNTQDFVCTICEMSIVQEIAGYLIQGECKFSYGCEVYDISHEDDEWILTIDGKYQDITQLEGVYLIDIAKAFKAEYPGALNFYRANKLTNSDRNLLKKFDK